MLKRFMFGFLFVPFCLLVIAISLSPLYVINEIFHPSEFWSIVSFIIWFAIICGIATCFERGLTK